MEEAHRAGQGAGAGASVSSKGTTLPRSPPAWKLASPVRLDFKETSLHKLDIKPLAPGDWFNLQSLCPPVTRSVPWATCPQPLSKFSKSSNQQNERHLYVLTAGNSNGLRSSVLGTGARTKYVFIIIKQHHKPYVPISESPAASEAFYPGLAPKDQAGNLLPMSNRPDHQAHTLG